MIVDRREHCNKRPMCMTASFMFGMVLGAILYTNGSWIHTGLSILVASAVFHLTYVRDFSIRDIVGKVIKKGF
jgi:hypothetical protein